MRRNKTKLILKLLTEKICQILRISWHHFQRVCPKMVIFRGSAQKWSFSEGLPKNGHFQGGLLLKMIDFNIWVCPQKWSFSVLGFVPKIVIFRFWVSTFGFWVSTFGFWVSTFGFWVAIFGLNPLALRFAFG